MNEVDVAIQQLEESFPVSLLCRSLNVSRSAYSAWREHGVSARKRDDNRLRPLIRGIFREHRRRYGARRIVGWDLPDQMREPLVVAALRGAIALRPPRPGLIHHTDRGGQYAGVEYRNLLARAGMSQSMSRADNCYDNAFMESCFGTLKTELEMEAYPKEHVARKEIPDYLRYDNTRRRHSALDYLTPEAYEAMISGGARAERGTRTRASEPACGDV